MMALLEAGRDGRYALNDSLSPPLPLLRGWREGDIWPLDSMIPSKTTFIDRQLGPYWLDNSEESCGCDGYDGEKDSLTRTNWIIEEMAFIDRENSDTKWYVDGLWSLYVCVRLVKCLV